VILVAIAMVSAAFISEQHIATSTEYLGFDDPNLPDNPNGSGNEVPLCHCHCGTSVVVEKTAIGFWEIATEYNWTVEKTMDPLASDMTIGDSMDVDVIIDADREQTGSSEEVWGVRGEITVTNTGDRSTFGFEIWDVVQKRVGTHWVGISCAWVLHPWIEELGSGETKSYSYEIFFDGPVDTSAQYRNIAKVRIKNHSGHIGCWFGPDEKESFTIPSTPTVIGSMDYTATLVDSMVVPMGLSVSGDMDGPWYLSGPSTIEYTITVTNTGLASGECARIVNTAILTEDDTLEERTDDANVTICSLGHPPGELIAYKFNDTDMNGVWDEGEYPIQGWMIYLKDTQGNTIATAITDSDGKVVFSPLVVGTYIVEEDDGDGWFNTTSDSFEISIDPEQIVEVEFGNAMYSGICVFKYEDYDGTDAPLVWDITLLDDEYNEVASGATGADAPGWICFGDLEMGTYYVIEAAVAGWYGTENITGNVTVILESGDSKEVIFGNTQYVTVEIYKYEDMDGYLDTTDDQYPADVEVDLLGPGWTWHQLVGLPRR